MREQWFKESDAVYHRKFIDEETGEPLEGLG
jgi:hypothetical protein